MNGSASIKLLKNIKTIDNDNIKRSGSVARRRVHISRHFYSRHQILKTGQIKSGHEIKHDPTVIYAPMPSWYGVFLFFKISLDNAIIIW